MQDISGTVDSGVLPMNCIHEPKAICQECHAAVVADLHEQAQTFREQLIIAETTNSFMKELIDVRMERGQREKNAALGEQQYG
jgi:hypothetical protein